MIDIGAILVELAIDRPIFHSEADFQHALAWKIHHSWPECSMRLEFKPPNLENRLYLDIWTSDSSTAYAVELKYKTRPLSLALNNEAYNLVSHSAQDISRYDYLKDIQRLEQVVIGRQNTIGYAILLTNDRNYWSPPRSGTTVDSAFRTYEGRTIAGKLVWGSDASNGTTRGREEPILLKKNYVLKWKDYSQIGTGPNNQFRYLLTQVSNDLQRFPDPSMLR